MTPPGWHGKLPSLGDFAGRRLDTAFIDQWDAWIACGLHHLRGIGGERWLAAYLASPSWRFLLMPGVLVGEPGARGWAGVLMPSVDRVGRYYPLTVALPVDGGPSFGAPMQALWHWLGGLDELARDALHDDWSIDVLESALAALTLPDLAGGVPASVGPVKPTSSREGALVELPLGSDAPQVIGLEAQQAWASHARGRCWWQAVPDDGPRRLLTGHGLPDATDFARLFGPASGTAETIALARPRQTP